MRGAKPTSSSKLARVIFSSALDPFAVSRTYTNRRSSSSGKRATSPLSTALSTHSTALWWRNPSSAATSLMVIPRVSLLPLIARRSWC